MIDFPHLREQLNETGIAYLLLDLELGSTFARLAFDSSDPANKARNHINARKAYDSVSLLVKRVSPSAAQHLRPAVVVDSHCFHVFHFYLLVNVRHAQLKVGRTTTQKAARQELVLRL